MWACVGIWGGWVCISVGNNIFSHSPAYLVFFLCGVMANALECCDYSEGSAVGHEFHSEWVHSVMDLNLMKKYQFICMFAGVFGQPYTTNNCKTWKSHPETQDTIKVFAPQCKHSVSLAKLYI